MVVLLCAPTPVVQVFQAYPEPLGRALEKVPFVVGLSVPSPIPLLVLLASAPLASPPALSLHVYGSSFAALASPCLG